MSWLFFLQKSLNRYMWKASYEIMVVAKNRAGKVCDDLLYEPNFIYDRLSEFGQQN